jgi:hypothetical protein
MARLLQRGDRQVGFAGLTATGKSWSDDAMTSGAELDGRCDECGSTFVKTQSSMSGLCPECAHHLYGYPPCAHRMVAGRCQVCGWDGSVSAYVAALKRDSAEPL